MKAPDYFYDGQMLPFNGRSFDGVINTQVLEHAPNARSMLLEMNRVIKLGGVDNFTSDAMAGTWRALWLCPIYQLCIIELLKNNGFEIESIVKYTGAIEAIAVTLNV